MKLGIRLLGVALAALFYCLPAHAQNPGVVTSHAFAIGKGPGTNSFTSLLCASAQVVVGQSAADPICRTLSGDVTLNASGVTAIGSNKVTLGMMATLAADSMIGNLSGSAATPASFAMINCGSSLTYSTSTHSFGCNAGAGTGTVTSAAYVASTGIGITGTTPCTTTCTWTFSNTGVLSVDAQVGAFTTGGGLKSTGKVLQQTLDSQVLQAAPSNPAGTASTTQVMMGMGSTCHLTPSYSSRIEIDFEGTVTNNTAGNSTSMNVRVGTGTAPANAAAVTGTALLNSITSGGGVGAVIAPSFHLSAVATGLTPGTAYWADMSISASANSSTISNMNCTLKEVL